MVHAQQKNNAYSEVRITSDVARADSLYKAGDFSAAFNLLDPIVSRKVDNTQYPASLPKAFYLMGKVQQYGFSDCEAGKRMYDICIEQFKYAPAYFDLGRYWMGNDCNIVQDSEKAFHLFREGAKRGDAGCQYEVAYIYSYGIYCEKDLKKGEMFLRMALKQEYPDADWLMGVYLKENIISSQYYPEWLDYWVEGANRGSYKCAEAIHYDKSGEHQFCKQFGIHD